MRVSVVIAVYNGAWCIERALDSVLRQTRRPDEVLVCDDGSTDGTPDLVEHRYGDPIRVLRLPHRNASATRRVGLDQATGDWLAFMDADDAWAPEKNEREIAFIESHPEVRLVMSDGAFVSAEAVIRESWLSDYFDPVLEMAGDLAPLLVERCFALVSSVMVEREAYHEVGGLDPEIARSYDYDLWLKVLARYPGGVLAERLVNYYSSPGTLSRNVEANNRDDLALMRRVMAGAVGGRADLKRIATRRAAVLDYDLGLLCLRTGRIPDGRAHLWRTLPYGSLRRRMLALAGTAVPGWAITRLMRSPWLKAVVFRSRESGGRMLIGGESRGSA